MHSKITFGSWEATCLVIVMISTKAALNAPRVMVESVGTAAWILAIYTSLLAFIGFYVISKLYNKFGGKDLLDIGEIVGGRPVKIIAGIVILIFLIILILLVIRIFSEEMKTMGLINTPISFVMLFFALGAIVATYFGIEPLVRFQAIILPISLIGYVIFIIALIPSMEISNIFPVLGTGAYDIFIKSAFRISSYAEIIFLFLLAPFIKTSDDFRKTFDIEYQRPLIMPFIILIFSLSLLPESLTRTIELETKYFNYWASITTFGLTIILLIAARFVCKKKRVNKN